MMKPMLLCGALIFFCGAVCAEAEPEVKAKGDLEVAGATLLDGFEGPTQTLWSFDAADDEGLGEYVAEAATQGQKALKVSLRGKGAKGKMMLRREVGLDLSLARALLVDVVASSKDFSIALALKCDPDDIYQESKPVQLKEGANRDVRFALEGNTWKNAGSQWQFSGPPVNLNKVKRVMLVIFSGEQREGGVTFDNLRLDGGLVGESSLRQWRPEIAYISPAPALAEQHQALDFECQFSASYKDPFDAADICVGLRVQTPSGRVLDVRGFFSGAQKPPLGASALPVRGPFKALSAGQKPGARLPVWLLRFTPSEPGQHRLQFYIRNVAGETRTVEDRVLVLHAKKNSLPGREGGGVVLSRRDNRMLELQDGTPFYIFGQNVCWTQDIKPYLEKIKAYGGNTCRIWLCPWGFNLERRTEPGVYDLREARRLDEVMQLAESSGVRVIFCFTFHGATDEFWGDSAYNAANGGPCARAQDFFTDPLARRQFKRLLSYAASRWGASPALLSWELINEMNLAGYGSRDEMAAWTHEMAAHLKSSDPHGRLVTTSATRTGFLPEVWRDAGVDFVSMHGYGPDVSDLVYQYLSPFRYANKPVLLAEFGGGWNPGDDLPDKEGVRLQAALWLTMCSPACGAALPWWWDTHIEARGLYPVFAAARRFIEGEDRRERYTEWVRQACENGLMLSGVMDHQGARLYLHHPGWIKNPESRGKMLIEKALPVELTGMLDGDYKIELWDAREGKVFLRLEAQAKEGKLNLALPPRASEVGIKIDRRKRIKPGVR
jgi:hypothetical protein